MLKLVVNNEWTTKERIDLHMEAIEAVKAEMNDAIANGRLIAYREAGERLSVLEHCMTGEAQLLIKKIA